jgi:thiamine-phosphate pyrophosphorylase
MKLIIMTKPAFFVEEDKIVTTLFEEGLESLHLNKPGCEPVYWERFLTLLPDEYYRRITVHNHFYLKDEYGLRGIHLENPSQEVPYGYRGRLSCTCSEVEEVRAAKKRMDYIFFNVKQWMDAAHDNNDLGFHTVSNEVAGKHVYAMGGVDVDNIRQMRDMGFGGVVVCSDLWDKFDIHQGQDYKELILQYIRLQRAAEG